MADKHSTIGKTVLAAYNAKVESILGSKLLTDRQWRNPDGELQAAEPWQQYFGVEFELEVDKNSTAVTDLYAKCSPLQRDTLNARDEYKNYWLAHYVAGRVLPSCSKFAIAKRDGSMSNGIEFVSLPMSLSLHQKSWASFFEAVNKEGLVVRKTCGMHVHVSRGLLTNLQVGKILQFLHTPLNSKLVCLIAGRTPPKKYANLESPYRVKDCLRMSQRYSAFNLTNAHTVEFRIFKGVSAENRFLANLEFCAALVSFCAPANTSLRELTAKNFLQFVSRNASMYRNLEAFLVAKRVLRRRHKKVTAAKLKKFKIGDYAIKTDLK